MRTPIFTPSRTGTCTSFSWIMLPPPLPSYQRARRAVGGWRQSRSVASPRSGAPASCSCRLSFLPDHIFLRHQPHRGGVHLHEVLLVLAHHRWNGSPEHRADVLDLREVELRKAVEVRNHWVPGQREARDDALHACSLDHLAFEPRVLVQPVILELRVSQVAAPADGPDGFQLPRSPDRP